MLRYLLDPANAITTAGLYSQMVIEAVRSLSTRCPRQFLLRQITIFGQCQFVVS
ncbi:hypothetical protein M728_005554 (plasmid) [Ensifer sp. WSM1721]